MKKNQRIAWGEGEVGEIHQWLERQQAHRILVVASAAAMERTGGRAITHLSECMGMACEVFSGFAPNPQQEAAEDGRVVFRESNADALAAVGGGSAIDVAKVIRGESGGFSVPFFVLPTTAGTGSEATHFAVTYQEGRKLSLTQECYLPDAVWFLPGNLATLPVYQRKATVLDAFCHAVESYWSVHSTEESKRFSREALSLIEQQADGYIEGRFYEAKALYQAAYLAGCAIDLTQTTAGHAMSYRLTKLAGISHGHAAALCVDALARVMAPTRQNCLDCRGIGYLREVLSQLTLHLAWLKKRLDRWGLRELPLENTAANIQELAVTVNPVRLKNHPIRLGRREIESAYRAVLR